MSNTLEKIIDFLLMFTPAYPLFAQIQRDKERRRMHEQAKLNYKFRSWEYGAWMRDEESKPVRYFSGDISRCIISESATFELPMRPGWRVISRGGYLEAIPDASQPH